MAWSRAPQRSHVWGSAPWTLPSGTPPLQLPAADAPERHRSVLALDAAAALGQDAAELALDANERPARPAGRR